MRTLLKSGYRPGATALELLCGMRAHSRWDESCEMEEEEMKALSVRQPWGWLIVNGYKDIENRDWNTKLRGRIWIHTGVHRVTKAEYEQFVEDCEPLAFACFRRLMRLILLSSELLSSEY